MAIEHRNASEKKWLFWGVFYAAILFGVICVLNYIEPYSPEPVTRLNLWQIILWGGLYISVIVVPLFTSWRIVEFGFSLNWYLVIATFLVIALCMPVTGGITRTGWGSAMIEAFARTGEEVFF